MTLSDLIPPGMTFVSATQVGPGPVFICSTPNPGDPGTVSCTTPAMLPGESAQFTFVFNISGDTEPGTSFTNIATAATAGDLDPENDSAVAVTSTPPPPQADMSVLKSGPAAAGPGTNVTFTLAVSNNGPDAAADVSLQDTLPGDMTFVSIQTSGTPLSCATPAVGAGGTISCTALTYPAGGATTVTIVAQIPADSNGTEYVNTAIISATTADPNEENNSSTITTTVSAVDLSVIKTGNGGAIAGDQLTYTITVANAGPNAALNVNLLDALPEDTTMVAFIQDNGPAATCTFPPPGFNGSVSCNFVGLGDGTSAQFTLTVEIGDTLSITNTAIVDSDSFDVDPANDTSSVTTIVTPLADLAVTKDGPDTAAAGSNVTYSIAVTNNGPSTAMNVILTDTLPPEATFVSMTQDSGPAFTCNTTTCTIAQLAPGVTATFTLVAQTPPSTPAGSNLTNPAGVSTTTDDPDDGNDTDSVTTAITTSADLAVTKSGPAAVTPGSNITYTITLVNNGPSDAANVSLADTLPANTTLVSMQQTGGSPAFACASTTCTVATFPAGASAAFTLVAQTSPSTPNGSNLTNSVTVSSSTPDPDGNDNTATSTATAGANADLVVVKSGPAVIEAGTNITYTVTLTNNGPSDAANVTLSDPLPPGTTFVSSSQTGHPFTCDATINCTAATMPAGASTVFTFVLAVSPGADPTLTNTATASSTTPDPTPTNGSSSTTAAVSPQSTDASITKTASVNRVAVGQSATYTIVVTNNGPGAALNTTVTDTLPPGTTLTSASSTQGTCTGSTTVVCTIGTLSPTGTATITLNVTFTTPGLITNTATVTISNADTNPANNTATAILAVAENIPTLSTLALGALAAMLALIAIKVIR